MIIVIVSFFFLLEIRLLGDPREIVFTHPEQLVGMYSKQCYILLQLLTRQKQRQRYYPSRSWHWEDIENQHPNPESTSRAVDAVVDEFRPLDSGFAHPSSTVKGGGG